MIRLVPVATNSARLPLQQIAGCAGVCFAGAQPRSRVVIKDGPLGKGEIR